MQGKSDSQRQFGNVKRLQRNMDKRKNTDELCGFSDGARRVTDLSQTSAG